MQMPEKKVLIAILLVVSALGCLCYTFGGSLFGSEAQVDEAEPFEDFGDDSYPAADPPASNPFNGQEEKRSVSNTGARRGGFAASSSNQGSIVDRVDGILDKLMEKRRQLNAYEYGMNPPGEMGGPANPVNFSPEDFFDGSPTQRDPLGEYPFTGVLVGESSACALMGGYILREGDTLPTGHQIVKIFRKSVHLMVPGTGQNVIKFIEPRRGLHWSRTPEETQVEEDPELELEALPEEEAGG